MESKHISQVSSLTVDLDRPMKTVVAMRAHSAVEDLGIHSASSVVDCLLVGLSSPA